MRSAAAGERVQDGPRWLGIVVRPAAAGSADGLSAVGELQAEAEGSPGRGQVTRPAGQVLLGVVGTGPIRAVTKISVPVEKADSPVTATATRSVGPSSRVSIGTMPGKSASGGSHG